MGMRSGTTFKKRQKEIARMEKQRDKAARRLQRKAEKAAGITHTEDDSAESGEQDDESGEFSLGAGSNPGNETI